MSNQEDFEKWAKVRQLDMLKLTDAHYVNQFTAGAQKGYFGRQPEIDALETTREKLHEMLVRRNIEICELKAEITRLRNLKGE